MADADLTLDGGNAIVDGDFLVVRCLDLKLDAPSRRSTNTGQRRALVHGFNDELVVNWAKDYPGGVTIRGNLSIPEKIKQNHVRMESTDLHLDHPARRSAAGGERRALVHGFNDELVLNWARDYPGGTAVHGALEVQKGGSLRLRNGSGNAVAELDANANLFLGGNGQNGDIFCMNTDGQEIIRVNGQAKSIDFKDTAGTVRLRIDSDQFTSSPWPAWTGEPVASVLNVVTEIRRLKEEVVALRAEVEALKVAP
jgi:hypothetical protein